MKLLEFKYVFILLIILSIKINSQIDGNILSHYSDYDYDGNSESDLISDYHYTNTPGKKPDIDSVASHYDNFNEKEALKEIEKRKIYEQINQENEIAKKNRIPRDEFNIRISYFLNKISY